MVRQSARPSRSRTICRRTAPTAVALIAAAAVCSPAFAASPTIVVAGDSVVASSLPSFGQATIQATRPDAVTGKPVVIGFYSGTGNPFSPFSVNTTTPTPLNSTGDCWQKGALPEALTPDLQPGDTITLTQSAGFFGGTASTTSVPVGPPGGNTAVGPLAGCDQIAPWARNAITKAPSSVTDGPITVSGVVQPLATGVSVSATDGTHTSSPVSVTPAADGSWSATIPAASMKGLDNTTLNVTPVVAVPDVITGAPAHIAGVSDPIKKMAPDSKPAAPGSTGGNGQSFPPSGQTPSGQTGATTPGNHGRKPRVTALHSASRVTLAAARSHGITASFVVPAGATMIEVELMRGNKALYVAIVRAGKAGSVQTVRLGGSRLNRLLSRGQYTIAVKAGTSRSAFGAPITRALVVR